MLNAKQQILTFKWRPATLTSTSSIATGRLSGEIPQLPPGHQRLHVGGDLDICSYFIYLLVQDSAFQEGWSHDLPPTLSLLSLHPRVFFFLNTEMFLQ